jgi:hypothetical protein
MANSKGSAIAAIALIIALGAAGVGIYQIFFTPPTTMVAKWEDSVVLSFSGWTTIPANITFKTRASSVVLLEFSCQSKLQIIGAVSSLAIYFFVDGTLGSYVYTYGYSTEDSQDIYDSFSMRDYITDLTAGAHNVTVRTYIDDGGTSFIRDSVLSVTIL